MAEKIDNAKRPGKRKTAQETAAAPRGKAANPAPDGTEAPRGRGRPKASGVKNGRALAVGAGNLRSKLKEQKQSFIQAQILEVAAELIAASGFRAVTIDDISATLGFSKSVIYYYLESKNDILWRIFDRIYKAYFEALNRITGMDADPDTKLYEIVRLHATNVMNYRAWTAISQREETELDEKQRRQITRQKREYDAAVEDIYTEGVRQGIFKDIPAHIAVAGLLGACNSIHTWYNPEGELGATEIAEHYAHLLADGFRVHTKAA